MLRKLKGMAKRIRALLMAGMLATIFPWLRITGETPSDSQPGTAVPQGSQETPAAKTPEERLKEMEGELAAKSSRIIELDRMAAESTSQAAHLRESLKQAINGYKNLLINSNPEVLPELICGETIAELNTSLTRGQELTGKVKTNLETQNQKARVPAGAPPRGPEDTSGLSAREKINRGVGR